jgi:hypothetical protein
MTKDELTRKVAAAINSAINDRMYGQIEIEFRAGNPCFIRTTKQEKLDDSEIRYGNSYR